MLDISKVGKEAIFAEQNIVGNRKTVVQDVLTTHDLLATYQRIFKQLSINDFLQIFFWEGINADMLNVFPSSVHLHRRTEEKMRERAIWRLNNQNLDSRRVAAIRTLESIKTLRDETDDPREAILYERSIKELQEQIDRDIWPTETVESLVEEQKNIYAPPSFESQRELLWVRGYEWDEITEENINEKLQELRVNILLRVFKAKDEKYQSEASAIRRLFYLYQFL